MSSNSNRPGCLAALARLFGFGPKQPAKSIRYTTPDFPYRLRDDFLSPAEASFFQVLKTMVGDKLLICPKVSLAELFFVPRHYNNVQAYQNKIDRKRVDFVLCDLKTLKPIFAIELDDSSHERPDRIERDDFVNEVFEAAGFPLARVKVQEAYNTSELAELFKRAMREIKEYSAESDPGAPLPRPTSSQPPICPKCGVAMVIRTARKGDKAGQSFYGCPNYPRCWVVIPID